ncbi:MAG: hypothetical protein HYY48_05360 [Gammaproteobacteria bacterium]|nr:hypothetical protein [Gammaproteobacteria bacterium]
MTGPGRLERVSLMNNPLYLAIDQGGHASRALVFDRSGAIIRTASRDIETNRKGIDHVEHDPDALLDSITGAIDEVLNVRDDHGALEIAAAGFATQRSSIVCWDRRDGTALSPVISWQDRRAADWLDPFRGRAGEIHERTGLVLSPHYGAGKLRWCLDHLPAVREARDQGQLACGPLASFILFRLLRERPFVADPANASRTQLWDFRKRGWAPSLLELFGVPTGVLPACVPSRHRYGTLDTRAGPLPVEVCTGDQSAALFAFGEPCADNIYINAGTGAFLQRVTGKVPLYSPQLLSSVVWQSGAEAEYALEGTVNGAGSALRQVGGELAIPNDQLDALVARALVEVREPPLFLNGVSGLGSPFWRADFQSRFIGDGNAVEKLAAVAESIVFLVQANLDEMTKCAGAAARIVISGGLAKLNGQCQKLADLSGIPVERPRVEEATARGLAFLLAGWPAAWCAVPGGTRFPPSAHPALAARYRRWLREMEI